MIHQVKTYTKVTIVMEGRLGIYQREKRSGYPRALMSGPRRINPPLIANCVILLVCINLSQTGYFSLLSGTHLSPLNYYCARASGETQTLVNLMELWEGLSSLDGQSTGGVEGPIAGLY